MNFNTQYASDELLRCKVALKTETSVQPTLVYSRTLTQDISPEPIPYRKVQWLKVH